MNVKQLKQELTKRGLSTDGLKLALVERLEQAMQQPTKQQSNTTSNEDYHTLAARAASDASLITGKEEEIAQLEAQLTAAKQTLTEAQHRQTKTQLELKDLEPRLSFSPKLPTSVLLSILGQVGKKAGERAACVKQEWRDVVETAKAMGMYDVKVLSVAAGGHITAICTVDGLFTCGGGTDKVSGHGLGSGLGHGGGEDAQELSPRLVEALVGRKVVGVSAGGSHTAVWTEAGELFTFGRGDNGKLGHGTQNESVPRLVEALVGKKVIDVAAGEDHTAVLTEAGEAFTFWAGYNAKLGHGGEENELVPRLVEALE